MATLQKTGLRLASAALAATLLTGCTLFGPQEFRVSAVEGDALPIASPAPLEAAVVRQGPVFNELGGEVPVAAPSPQVEEVEIDDLPTR